MTAYAKLKARIDRGETIILDGGTATDIQARGAVMSGTTWCADANAEHGDIVRAVHRDYIAAGADVIAANTYAASALLMNACGRDADIAVLDRLAIEHARAAANGTQVCVAGSMSTMRPMEEGSDRNNLSREWPQAVARALFANKVQVLKNNGVDLIMMEMMRDTDYAVYACEAALDTGLPVWIGLSAEPNGRGGLQGWGREDCAFEDIAATLAALKPDVMNIMHTSPNDTDAALAILKKVWSGPIGTYPESGYFKSPDWSFVDIIAPEALVEWSKGWQAKGVTLFGGCCGIGPQHIKVLAQEMRS
jgi:S-methylmethionine-dependent homocysteine/selenocysteine methylase